eukprot:14866196-Ditylum_brightwellii.AAC.1
MESTLDDGNKVYAIGYKYTSKKGICFIASEGTGSTKPGKPHEARWSDRHESLRAITNRENLS